MGNRFGQHDLLCTMVRYGKTPVYQLEITEDSRSTASHGPREDDSCTLRQRNNIGLYHQVWGNQIVAPHGPGPSDLGFLPGNRHEDHDELHQVREESCRSPLSCPMAPDRMESAEIDLSGSEPHLGSTLSGSVCLQEEPPAQPICELAPRQRGNRNRCTNNPMDKRTSIYLSTLGPDLSNPSETPAGTGYDDPSNPTLEVGDMVPDLAPSGDSTSSSPSGGRATRIFSQRPSIALDPGSLVSQRQRIEREGASQATVKVFAQSALLPITTESMAATL